MSKLSKALQPFHNVPVYELLTEEGIEKIHQATLNVLQDVGLAFYDDEALEILKANGAKVEGEMVYFGSEVIEEFLSKAPETFTQIARNPERSVQIGGNAVTFAPVYGPPYAYDLENGRRNSTIQDFKNFVKLAYLSPYIHHSGGTIVEPNDLPVKTRHLDMLLAHIQYSDKPFMGSVTSMQNAKDSVEIVKRLFGEHAIEENPALISLVNVNSPRQFDETMLGALKVYAKARQAVIVTPFIMAGSMAPITIAGALTQQNAEALAGIVFTQMVNPGAPVIYGSYLSTVDMKSGAPVFGSPESQIAIYASAQIARHYKLPVRSGGMYTTSKLTDAQSAYESMMTMIPTALGRINFVLHAAGWLESGMTAGFEKFILDCDILGMMHKFYKGLDLSEEEFGMDSISEVKPGGHYLDSSHTLRHFRTAFYQTDIMDYKDYMQWDMLGRKDSIQRANERYHQLMESYEPPPLDEGIKESIDSFIAQRVQEMETS